MRRYCGDVISAIKRFGNSFETFASDTHYFNTVSMSIMQVGELAGGLTEEFKDATRAQIPWNTIRGMRNRFAYGYEAMDEGNIWEAATQDIPVLAEFCDGVLERGEIPR